MRALLAVLAGVALLAGVGTQPASAGKGTDIERFIRRVEKYVAEPNSDLKAKGLCVCQDGGGFHGEVGMLIYFGQLGDPSVAVQCAVLQFSGSGDYNGSGSCYTFEVLSK